MFSITCLWSPSILCLRSSTNFLPLIKHIYILPNFHSAASEAKNKNISARWPYNIEEARSSRQGPRNLKRTEGSTQIGKLSPMWLHQKRKRRRNMSLWAAEPHIWSCSLCWYPRETTSESAVVSFSVKHLRHTRGKMIEVLFIFQLSLSPFVFGYFLIYQKKAGIKES